MCVYHLANLYTTHKSGTKHLKEINIDFISIHADYFTFTPLKVADRNIEMHRYMHNISILLTSFEYSNIAHLQLQACGLLLLEFKRQLVQNHILVGQQVGIIPLVHNYVTI